MAMSEPWVTRPSQGHRLYRAGHSEILTYKTLGPLTGFKSGVIREETGR